MKTAAKPDQRIHIRKKVAGGTTGAVLGAVVGGPVGALVGGVIGTMVGGAAESGKLRELTAEAKKGKPAAKAKAAVKQVAQKALPQSKVALKTKRRGTRSKSKSKKG